MKKTCLTTADQNVANDTSYMLTATNDLRHLGVAAVPGPGTRC